MLPNRPGLGTWRSVAVWRERDVLKIPADLMPPEYAAQARELCTAWRLLEDHGGLRPGDGVLLNAANSTVGHALVQLCRMLKLRAVCVLRPGPRFEAAAARLRALGAAEVLRDGGDPLAAQLAAQQGAKFFAKPRLALDAVGGASAAALAEALADGCPLVVYGCLSGRAPAFPWAHWVHKDLQVKGFSLRRWMAQPGNKKKASGLRRAGVGWG